MSTLVLVRHAQATPFENVTDRLSSAGQRQAELLGEFWRQRGVGFDEVYCGSMQRHRETAKGAGLDPLDCRPGFDEYDADGILRALPDFAPAADNRQLQKLFDAAMPRWLAGTLAAPGLETWTAFRERVSNALREILTARGSNRRVVVFTSAGPIAVAVQSVLRAPEAAALELNWRIRNCSLTEFLFSGARVSLDSFNATPHLAEVTYR